jgi:hypothetical protein
MTTRTLFLAFVLVGSWSLLAGEWQVDTPTPGIYVLRNEGGAWGGWSMGVSHINNSDYQARKTLDLTQLPKEARDQAKDVRLRFYFGIQDYSWNSGDRVANGLNEEFEIVANGQAMRFKTSDPRFLAKPGRAGKLEAGWTDIDLPLDVLANDTLQIVIRKVPANTEDDYIYPGLDNTVPNTASSVSFDGGKTWRNDQLNTIKAQGEYMIRLLVATRALQRQVRWTPEALDDPDGFAAYCQLEDSALRLEPRPGVWDMARDVTVAVRHQGPAPAVEWLLREKSKAPFAAIPGGGTVYRLSPCRKAPDALLVRPGPETVLGEVTISYQANTTPRAELPDIRPEIQPPAGQRQPLQATVRKRADGTVLLDNGALRAVFRVTPKLELLSLHAAEINRNILADPAATQLFRLKVGDRVLGCRDATVERLTLDTAGFSAILAPTDLPALRIQLQARLVEDELDLGCTVRCVGPEPIQFHLSFPHLAGLQLGADPSEDYYLFPWGGGVIGNHSASLRTAYGENTAWWQMIDLFNPQRGGGIYLRVDDPTGLYKAPHLRKGKDVSADFTLDDTGRGYLLPEMQWQTALAPVPGISLCFDYLRRNRQAGQEFIAPRARLGTHAGDWRQAMRRYADWSGKTWPQRPFPSRLTTRWNVIPAGWGQAPLVGKDGAYRTDYIKPENDVPELMSWWTWSDKGPWGASMDRLEQDLGPALYKRYKSYWVVEPVSGKLMYPLNRGDYDGYMPLWGGLPALRAHIRRMQDAGLLPMFYTDPLLACANTKIGSEHGPEYGVMNPRWKDAYKTGKTPAGYVGSYGSYNMCQDTEWYQAWLAKTIARVCRETGIDGVRLDEYGHRGYVCTSPHHQHIYAEPEHNAWLQALARSVRLVHQAMDKVRPDLILTTEFPGTDQMAAALDGAIVYDLRRVRAFRPVPINLFRFYFPACRVLEINRPPRPEAKDWMLWNMVAAFGGSIAYKADEHRILVANNDALALGRAEPLVPTLVPRVYANLFTCPGKTIWTVLNGTDHTVDGPLIQVDPDPNTRFIDLLTGRELVPDNRGAIGLRLRRNQTVVIARLTKE